MKAGNPKRISLALIILGLRISRQKKTDHKPLTSREHWVMGKPTDKPGLRVETRGEKLNSKTVQKQMLPKGLIVDNTAAMKPISHPTPQSNPGSAATCQCSNGIFPRNFRTAKGSKMHGIELNPTPMPILAP